jgi:hypothetical protein
MVVDGQGATSMWYEKGRKRTFEWQQGSVFSIPNVWHEHYAMSTAARLVSCTSAPLYMQLFNNNDFIFNCDYRFLDRFAEEQNYFDEAPQILPALRGSRPTSSRMCDSGLLEKMFTHWRRKVFQVEPGPRAGRIQHEDQVR